jgi:hypothetical protein
MCQLLTSLTAWIINGAELDIGCRGEHLVLRGSGGGI